MKSIGLGLLTCCLIFSLSHVGATRLGDEEYAANSTGAFYVFADKTVQVIQPSSLSVSKNLTLDSNGNTLTYTSGTANVSRTWNDVVFSAGSRDGRRYIIVNEGDVYTRNNGTKQYGYLSIIDAISQEFVARLEVGARPVHIYSINQTNSIWSHSDAEGDFYVISLNDPNNLSVSAIVPGHVSIGAHGKLAINDKLYPIAYGTNVVEPILPKYNLTSATRIANIQYNTTLPDPAACTGTHTIVYSPLNRHLYVECADGAGILEWNTVNDSFVQLHEISGVVAGTPADDLIIIGDQEHSTAALLQPSGNGRPSLRYGHITIDFYPYPYYPAFYRNNGNTTEPGNFTEYTVYFPLTRNTNLNNIRAAGNNVTTIDYLERPSDCQYSLNSTVASSSIISSAQSMQGLQLATNPEGRFYTPNCGACAAGINASDPSEYNPELSGLAFLNLDIFSSGGRNATTTLQPAGATLPRRNLASDANQCSFATEPQRAMRRGGQFIATVADLPQPSVYVSPSAWLTRHSCGILWPYHLSFWEFASWRAKF